MSKKLLLKCTIQVLGESIDIKIFKNEYEDGFVNYTFTQSHFYRTKAKVNHIAPEAVLLPPT